MVARAGFADGIVSEELATASRVLAEELGDLESEDSTEWSYEAYLSLLGELAESGHGAQAEVVVAAALGDGFVDRSTIYQIAGFDESRSLRRFSLPAQGIALRLVERGVLGEATAMPLEALYEGPGRTVGYRVPDEFVRFEDRRGSVRGQVTWLEAARIVASSDPTRIWSVQDLVEEIDARGLRDLSSARTPTATLGRDLLRRDEGIFERVDRGLYRLAGPSSDPFEA